MGNCVSFAPEGTPKCDTCGKVGQKEWAQMTPPEKNLWLWHDDSCICRACKVKCEVEKHKYERERKFYAKAKGQLYPRQEKHETLRRIHSNEAWQGTASFYESWKLPSGLANLLQPWLGERKGTGFVGDTSDAAGPGTASEGGVAGSGGASSATILPHAQLEQLDEELEMVEEESLHGDSEEGSVRSGSACRGSIDSGGCSTAQIAAKA